jgi:roadblock/LC7 domain-containing protein
MVACKRLTLLQFLPNIGVAFAIVSYFETIRICSMGDSSIFVQEDMDAFNEAIYEELAILKTYC